MINAPPSFAFSLCNEPSKTITTICQDRLGTNREKSQNIRWRFTQDEVKDFFRTAGGCGAPLSHALHSSAADRLTAADTACSDAADDTNLEYHLGDFKRVADSMLTACDSNGDGMISHDEFEQYFEKFEKVRKQQLFSHFLVL